MNEQANLVLPETYESILAKTKELNFDMPSDILLGSLLRTLVCSKPGGQFLELGTGTGLSLSWMMDGLKGGIVISIDNDPELIRVAKTYLDVANVEIICQDGGEWISNNSGKHFDLVFADTWPGKYHYLEETLEMVKIGGIYLIDDMLPQPNWPDGHAEKAEKLVQKLESLENFQLTKMHWSTGLIMAVRTH